MALAVLLLVLTVPSRGSAQEAAWTGCYALERGGWGWSYPIGDSTQHEPPRRFELRLDTARWGGDGTWRRAVPPITSYEEAPGMWRPAGRDSLHVLWSSGFTGVRLRLGLAGDSLTGTATAFMDERFVGVAWPTAPVVVRKVECAPALRRPAPRSPAVGEPRSFPDTGKVP